MSLFPMWTLLAGVNDRSRVAWRGAQDVVEYSVSAAPRPARTRRGRLLSPEHVGGDQLGHHLLAAVVPVRVVSVVEELAFGIGAQQWLEIEHAEVAPTSEVRDHRDEVRDGRDGGEIGEEGAVEPRI